MRLCTLMCWYEEDGKTWPNRAVPVAWRAPKMDTKTRKGKNEDHIQQSANSAKFKVVQHRQHLTNS